MDKLALKGAQAKGKQESLNEPGGRVGPDGRKRQGFTFTFLMEVARVTAPSPAFLQLLCFS